MAKRHPRNHLRLPSFKARHFFELEHFMAEIMEQFENGLRTSQVLMKTDAKTWAAPQADYYKAACSALAKIIEQVDHERRRHEKGAERDGTRS